MSECVHGGTLGPSCVLRECAHVTRVMRDHGPAVDEVAITHVWGRGVDKAILSSGLGATESSASSAPPPHSHLYPDPI